MLEWSNKEFKITMINVLKALKEKIDDRQEQVGNVSEEMETLKESSKEFC